MMRFKATLLALLFAPLFAAHADDEENEWTRFRGPNGSGISGAQSIPVKWTAKEYNWTIELPGDGS
ncbi:MAG: hypothetical protein OSB39_14795, partial [Opitutales bacterium]|nr:hypothetical protein [Opitutales bacterium]